MGAEELLRQGDVRAALADLTQRVRRAPADPRLRVFLFQLLAVLGHWERALNQLQVAGELDPGALAMVNTYREALHCEALRERVFAGERDPLVLGEPAQWLALLTQALKLGAQGKAEQAQGLRQRSFEQAPACAGRIDGEPFQWIADADGRLGPVIEAVVNGRYYWVPFQQIRRLELEVPSDLRDLVWTPAQLALANGGETVALIPSRYAGSAACTDPRLQLARLTDWQDLGGGIFAGLGQRMLVTDQGDYPLLGTRLVELDDPSAEPASA